MKKMVKEFFMTKYTSAGMAPSLYTPYAHSHNEQDSHIVMVLYWYKTLILDITILANFRDGLPDTCSKERFAQVASVLRH